MKDIKTKERVNRYIKVLDKKQNMHNMKNTNISQKDGLNEDTTEHNEDPTRHAVDKVIQSHNRTMVLSAYKIIKHKKKSKKGKENEQRENISEELLNTFGANDITNEVEAPLRNYASTHSDSSRDHSTYNSVSEKLGRQHIKNKYNNTDASFQSTPIPDIPIIKTKHSFKHEKAPNTAHEPSYIKSMRSLAIKKLKEKLAEAKQNPIKTVLTMAFSGIKGTANGTRKVIRGIQTIIGLGFSFLLLFVFLLFISIFAYLSYDSGVYTSSKPLSPEVLEYADTVRHYAEQNEIEEYTALLLAIMMQESGGKGTDPMQASECGYNEKYPREPNGITDPDYSIEVGVKNFADCLKKAKAEDPYDMEHIYLALQGYNYGQAYIKWAIDNFGGWTRANAKVYSDQMQAKLNTTGYGDVNYVAHVLQYYHFGDSDIVKIAVAQIGNIGGKPYWSWYGFNNRVEWCACFVSWCADQAGLIDKGLVPKFAYCPTGAQWFIDHNAWRNRTAVPIPGDIIFFDWEGDGITDHVGIVIEVDSQTVYTVEGNSTNDECRKNSYPIGSQYIYGYGSVKSN